MKLRMFKSVVKQGFVGLWRNRMMSMASISSVTAALLILGIVLILILNINNITLTAQQQFDEIQIYLEDEMDQAEIDKLGEVISSFDGVASLRFQSREQALEIMKEKFGDEGYILDGLETNPLPDSYIIQLSKIDNAEAVVERLRGLNGIEDIKYYRDIVEKLMSVANFVRYGGLIIIAVLMFISVFIISNTVKITVAARKREINIMKYVGATNGFIRGPFIVEGILLGLIGAAISILAITHGYKYLFTSINDRLYVLFTVYMVPHYSLFNDIVIIFTAIGVGIGILGSVLSLRRFLNV